MANGTSKEKLAFCKCKRSACVRNYCQCYDQKRVCGSACRCFSKRYLFFYFSCFFRFFYFFNDLFWNIIAFTIHAFKFTDCQNRFSTGAANEEIAKPSSSKYNSSEMDSSGSNNSRSNRKLLPNDTYETFRNSLFSTGKACHEAGRSKQQSERAYLETFHEKLKQLDKEIDKRKAENSSQK